MTLSTQTSAVNKRRYTQKWERLHPEKNRYFEHQGNARRRGIVFDLTFPEWWSVWETSGQWANRGRGGDKYVMSRYRDCGAYTKGNVFIQQGRMNLSLTPANKAGLPVGVYKRPNGRFGAHKAVRKIRLYLGTFNTVSEAVQAYQDAV